MTQHRARILVTGGRSLDDRELVFRVLDGIARRLGQLLIVHGGAPGADKLASDWARERGHAEEPHPADWSQGRKAGPMRNRRMVARGAALCVAFPGGRGTDDCARAAAAAGISVERYA